VHPVYLLALAKDNPKFSIVISHGHDDHLDDEFLSLFPKRTKIIIPQYKSRGMLKRLQRIGLLNICEASMESYRHGCFEFKSYINMSISRDDAVVSIRTPNNMIIHANDNWQKIVGKNLDSLQKDCGEFKSEEILYMSQCNLADGYPNIYTNYTSDEKTLIHNNRVNNIISTGLLNADMIGAKYFLNYAGYAASFIKGDSELRNRVSFKPNSHIQKICDDTGRSVTVLDMIPGDSFDFISVQKQFDGICLSEENLKTQSFNFYEKYNRVARCDSYKNYDKPSAEELNSGLKKFLNEFNDFVMPRLAPTNFNTDIVGCKIVFSASDMDSGAEIFVGGEQNFDNREIIFYASASQLNQIVLGKINWESLYIGYAGRVEVCPKNINIRPVVRWLAMYGYFYQRDKINL